MGARVHKRSDSQSRLSDGHSGTQGLKGGGSSKEEEALQEINPFFLPSSTVMMLQFVLSRNVTVR